uniref:Uncharacterized protein n=1 Tax=viral metagenome TaxID=1070528 RepID=A0A6C0JKK1_9ZZZZ
MEKIGIRNIYTSGVSCGSVQKIELSNMTII